MSCYKHCKTCTKSYVNHQCLSCVDETILYVDLMNYNAVPNGSCWEYCPASTYLVETPTKRECKDCPAYCFCDGVKMECPGCMNTTFLFDRVRNECFLKCPTKTYYSKGE